MRYNQTPMPPTPQSIMRKANTSRIARSLTDPVGGTIQPMPPIMPSSGGPALLGPPVHQPPQTDPFTPGIGGTFTAGGPAAQYQANDSNPALMSYEALMRSAGPGIRAAQPMLPPKPDGQITYPAPLAGGGINPIAPGFGPPMAGNGIDPISDPIGGHTDPFEVGTQEFGAPMAGSGGAEDPTGGNMPGVDPTPPTGGLGNTPNPGNANGPIIPQQLRDWWNGFDGTRYAEHAPYYDTSAPPRYNPTNPGRFDPLPTYVHTDGRGRVPSEGGPRGEAGGPRGNVGSGPNDTFNHQPHIPSQGGQVGTGTNTTPQESTIGRLWRMFSPYGAAQATHMIADYMRRHGGGTVGGEAHAVGGPRDTAGASPAVTPTHAQPGTHFDFTRGQYVHDNYAGGAQNNTQAANAMLMWSQNIHQPTNLRQSDEVSRFLTGPARRMVTGGGFEEVPDTGRSGYSGTTGNPTLTTDPRAIAAYNAYVANRGR